MADSESTDCLGEEILLLITKTQHEPDATNDVALVCSAKQGNTEAFEQLIERHAAMIFRVSMHITGSREDAEDTVQDAFLKAFQHLHRFEERAQFSTWLVRIAVNAALMRLRGSRRASILSIDEEDSPLSTVIADWQPDPEQIYKRNELKEILEQALTTLPEAHKIVFLLRDVEGMSIADTAEMLGLSKTKVKARLFRARLKLRQHLSRYFGQHRAAPAFRSARRDLACYI